MRANMQKVILVGGKFAGAKLEVPEGRKVLNIPNNTPQLAIVETHADVQRHLQQIAETKEIGVTNIAECDNPYILHPITIVAPMTGDTTSFVIACPPGVNVADAFMEVVAGYVMICQPETEH